MVCIRYYGIYLAYRTDRASAEPNREPPNRPARQTSRQTAPAAQGATNEPAAEHPTDRPTEPRQRTASAIGAKCRKTDTYNTKSPMDRMIHRAIVFRRVERARPSERARQRLRQRYTASRKRPAPSDLPTSLWQPSRGLQRTGGLPPPVRHTRQPATATAHA